jgi:hypothetical protein
MVMVRVAVLQGGIRGLVVQGVGGARAAGRRDLGEKRVDDICCGRFAG